MDLKYFLRGRLNIALSGLRNLRGRPLPRPLSLEEVLAVENPPPIDLVRLLEGRPNPGRAAVLEGYLAGLGIAYTRHPYATFEGSGVNFAIEVGEGEKLVILVAHHDAVPGSPGANDDGSAVAILLILARRLLADPPRRVRMRLLFTGGEEACYLGARRYVREAALDGLVGVLSLELCGIGDTFAIWDLPPAQEKSPILRALSHALDGLGFRRNETYHLVGRIPVFGSDHRAFAARGIPAFGLTVVPGECGDSLRKLVLSPWRSVLHQLIRRPPPFDTYHTRSDRSDALEASALYRVHEVLNALAHTF